MFGYEVVDGLRSRCVGSREIHRDLDEAAGRQVEHERADAIERANQRNEALRLCKAGAQVHVEGNEGAAGTEAQDSRGWMRVVRPTKSPAKRRKILRIPIDRHWSRR